MTEPQNHYEVVVVGAGLAGSTLAAKLAKDGREVALLEKDVFPRDKLCGEFLSPESQAILHEVGVLADLVDRAEKINSARFSAPSGRQIHVTLPGTALGVSRRTLDHRLFRAAAQHGAHALDATRVLRIDTSRHPARLQLRHEDEPFDISADLVVAAWGRRTQLDRQRARPFMAKRHPFVGFKRHHRASRATLGDLRGAVEIHGFDGGYCGMSFIETGEVNVCMLLEQRFVDALTQPRWPSIARAIAAANPRLADRLDSLTPSEDHTHAVAQVPFTLKKAYHDGLFFCGDAASMIAPLTGDGQAMAMESASMLADLLRASPPSLTPAQIHDLGARWQRAWRRKYRARLFLGRALQRMLFIGSALEIGLLAAGAVPGLADRLARLTRSTPKDSPLT